MTFACARPTKKLPPDGVAINPTDVTEGVVYEHHDVRVLAFDVDHGEEVKPALGYRIDYGGHAVLLSGDTRYSPNLIKHAGGVDVLVHEVLVATSQQLAGAGASLAAGIAHHTTPEQPGQVFATVKPRLAVYSHLVLFGNSTDDLIR